MQLAIHEELPKVRQSSCVLDPRGAVLPRRQDGPPHLQLCELRQLPRAPGVSILCGPF
jgi:hypothetical protein